MNHLLHRIELFNNSRVEIEPNQFLSLRFAGLPRMGSIQDAKLYVEFNTEQPFASNAVTFQVGGGSLTDPFVALEQVLSGSGGDTVLQWNITAYARNSTRVNDLKLVARNFDNGKKVRIDRAYVVVTYGPAPALPVALIQVKLYATDGWDQKNGKTLAQDGKLYQVQGSDNQRGEVEAGYFTSYGFQNLPPSARAIRSRRWEWSTICRSPYVTSLTTARRRRMIACM